MRQIRTVEDIAALTREEVWSRDITREELIAVRTGASDVSEAIHARMVELMPDVVTMVERIREDYSRGKRGRTHFEPVLALPPLPLAFAWTLLMQGAAAEAGTDDAFFSGYVHYHLAGSIVKLFAGAPAGGRDAVSAAPEQGDLPPDCGDSGCECALSLSGMRTNGGCRCEPHTMRLALRWWQRRVRTLEAELAASALAPEGARTR
jgi:hypothetical protein